MSRLNPIWYYDSEDKTTWKYLSFNVNYRKNIKEPFITWIPNPNFKFKHLDPHYSNSFTLTEK